MTDTSPSIATATLDLSEQVHLLTTAVEKQRRIITTMRGILVLVVVLGLRGWIADLFGGESILRGSALMLHSKGTKTAYLDPTEDGLGVFFESDNATSAGAILKADCDGLALVSKGKVLWRSE
jgi:type IV secretory pathway TrbD component